MLDNVHKLLRVNYMVQKRPSLSADNFSKGFDQNNLHICVQDLWSDILFSQLLDPFFHYLSARRPVREPTRLSRRGHQAFWHPHSDQPRKKLEIGPCQWTPGQGGITTFTTKICPYTQGPVVTTAAVLIIILITCLLGLFLLL